jgi:nucleoside-diphosphate-sugar epimerase
VRGEHNSQKVLVDGTFGVPGGGPCRCAQVVAASSASVYGMAEISDRRDTPPMPTALSAPSLFNEGLLRLQQLRLEYVALRYFNVYGRAWTCSAPTRKC